MTCYKNGERFRLIYRHRYHHDLTTGGHRSFCRTDYRDLLVDAHRRLGGPIVLVRDNLNVHRDARLRAFIDTHDPVRCYRLPPYAPELNPVESVWSLLRRGNQADTAFTDPTHLIHTLRHGLRRIQYRPALNGWLTATALTALDPVGPRPDRRASR